MTTERKQELTQLLEEALDNLVIRNSENQIWHIDEYIKLLQKYWSSYSQFELTLHLPFLEDFEPHVTSETTQSKLLDFIREAFKDAIHEDYIQSACSHVLEIESDSGYPLDSLLKQLLNITIGSGVERAVSAFVRCSESESASFQYIILLAGIKVDAEIEVSKGIRIKPFSSPIPDLLRFYLETVGMSPHFLGAQLIIDASVSPIFHKPESSFDAFQAAFKVEISNRAFRNTEFFMDFGMTFSHALSIVCNSPVRAPWGWAHLEKDELFYLDRLYGGGSGIHYATNISGNPTPVGEFEIAKAARLCKILANPSSNIGKKLKIPIDRWIKSKTDQSLVDQMIDLGIAFEALYLSETDYNREIRFRFSLHAAWHLAKDKEQRNALMKEFKAIYDLRSKAVHSGTVSDATSERIPSAQDLCRASIMKILEDGKFPDWNDLILGE